MELLEKKTEEDVEAWYTEKKQEAMDVLNKDIEAKKNLAVAEKRYQATMEKARKRYAQDIEKAIKKSAIEKLQAWYFTHKKQFLEWFNETMLKKKPVTEEA